MSAPSLRNIMQTPQREFALQNYTKKMIYTKKSALLMQIFINRSSILLII